MQNKIWSSDAETTYNNCAVFYKVKEKFGGLSNMSGGYPLKINGETIYSSEALYQACRFPHEPSWQKEIITQKSPMAAKMKSKKDNRRKDYSREDWEDVRVDLMRWVLRVKLAHHYTAMKEILLSTGDRPIVEKSRKDRFWGAVEDKEGILHGYNQLGQLLMELRSLVKTKSSKELTEVEPLDIHDFLLLNKPISTIKVVVARF